jgi:hypothetical protein
MSEDKHTLIPFESAGPYRFGDPPASCAAAAGAPDESWEDEPMNQFCERRGGVEATYEDGRLVQLTYGLGSSLVLDGMDLFADPTALVRLREVHASGKVQGGFVNFPELGICLGGFGKRRIPEGRVVIAYAREQGELMAGMGSV